MDYSHLAVLLLFIALGLFIAEIFIPSGGIITVIAILSLAGSVVCAWNAWWSSSPTTWWLYLASLIVLIPVSIIGALYALPRTGIGRRILLDAPELDEVTPYAAEKAHLSELIGKSGRTLTMLNPGGFVLVNGERMHCESEGTIIDPQSEVRVVRISGNRLVVRLIEDETFPGEPFNAEEPGEPRLDFDVPQS